MTRRLTSGHTKQTATATRPRDVLIGWRMVILTALAALLLLAAAPSAYARGKPPAGHRGKPPVGHRGKPPVGHRGKPPVGHRGKPPVGLPTPPPVPAGQLDQDLSGKLPALNINETPGDFLGEGHDQMAASVPPNLDIYETQKYGGGTVKSTPTDLRATPNEGFCYGCGNFGQEVSPWDSYDISSWHAYQNVGAGYSLTRVKVAASATNIYMAGATWNDNATKPEDGDYQLHLYKLPHDGSCASAGCAEKTLNLPSLFPAYSDLPGPDERLVVATSLAVGVVGGRTLIAVGLSDEGILIFDENLNQVAQIGDMAVPDGEPGAGRQTPVISLAFGPPSQAGDGGFLTAGVVSPWLTCFAWELNSAGQETHMTRLCGDGIDRNVVLSTAVVGVNGAPEAVFGLSNGAVYVVDWNSTAPFAAYGAGGPVLGLSGVTSSDDDPGNQHLVVGLEGDSGLVLKYGGGVLSPVPIGVGGATVGNWDQVRLWYPGYGAGRLQVANDSGGAVKVSLHWRPLPLFGCWLNDSVGNGGVPAFPADPTTIAAGQSLPASSSFFIGALTAAAKASCASAQPGDQGEWSADVVITPADDTADQHIVKLLVQRPGKVSILKQVGGDLTANLTGPGVGGSWGSWVLHVGGHGAPVAQAPPVVMKTSQRLTSAATGACSPALLDDPCRPVYRFDVSGAQWSGVAVDGQVTARVPPMTVQGTSDGVSWRDLGQLMPVTAPTVSGNTVTLGNASFFWQDDPGKPPLTAVRVVSGGLVSDVVRLVDLPAPALDGSGGETLANGVEAAPPGGANATLRPNGVDQARLFVTVIPSSGGNIAPNDRRYGLVYYRYDNNGVLGGLITGLYTGGDYGDYVAVGPWAGAYPDNGLGRGRPGKPRAVGARRVAGLGGGRPGKPRAAGARRVGGAIPQNYVVTTNTVPQSVEAEFNDTGAATARNGSPVAVVPDLTHLQASGTATSGIEVSGCGSTCSLAPTGTAPALFQAGGADQGPMSGLLFSAPAVNAVSSLPLQVVSDAGDRHDLGFTTLQVSAGQARLTNTSQFWPCDPIDTALVASGELVLAPSIPMKSGC